MTWQQVSHAAGLVIVAVVLLLEVASFGFNRDLDTAIPLALLGVATLLLGGPSGLQLVTRNHSGGSDGSG